MSPLIPLSTGTSHRYERWNLRESSLDCQFSKNFQSLLPQSRHRGAGSPLPHAPSLSTSLPAQRTDDDVILFDTPNAERPAVTQYLRRRT